MTDPGGRPREPASGGASTGPVPADWGVQVVYEDDRGLSHQVDPGSVQAILAAMRATTPAPAARGTATGPIFTHPGEVLDTALRGTLELEAGGSLAVERTLPAELPPGYHTLVTDAGPRTVVVSPGRCHLPGALRAWGWAVQLYSVRSARSWGMGDLGDLRDLGAWAARSGAGFQLVNPIHAALPGTPQQASPYYPSSRIYRNPLYLRVEDIPGAAGTRAVGEEGVRGRALNQLELLDRDRVYAAKLTALEAIFARFKGDPEFDSYRARQGRSLDDYATFCALVERHGRGWRGWPGPLRRPDSPAVRAFATGHARRVAFHQWVQWQLSIQLRAAAAALPVINDLAIGVDPDGADGWIWQDLYAEGVRVGAPPDEFNAAGQDWGLPPFDPHRLRAAGYQPWIETLRAAFDGGGGLRLDHVMGLFRLWWIPAGATSADGAYVHYRAAEMLDILALESHRAGAYVVGEDLGTVEPQVRRELQRRRVLSYRLLWFEDGDPSTYPSQAMAAVTTHDLPTVAGLWSGADLYAQEKIGLDPNRDATRRIRGHLQAISGVGARAGVVKVVDQTYAALGRAPSALLCASLEDACMSPLRPNMPGTVDAWPNWRIPLPVPLEELRELPQAGAIARSLNRQ